MLTRWGGVGFLSLILGPTALWAATYFVAPGGSDRNPGTQSKPWATLGHAFTNCVAGDTTLVQPGIYTTPGKLAICTSHNGTSNAPILFRANGSVTNRFPFAIKNAWNVFDGFTFTDLNTGYTCAWIARPARYCTITNCTAKNMEGQGPFFDNPGDRNPPEGAAQYCTIINCNFDTLTNGTFVTLMGVGNLVQGCRFANGYACDALRVFGSNNVVRGCTFTNITDIDGYENHPDILQTFGDTGYWLVDFLFEQNRVIHCPVQLMDFSMKSTPATGVVIPTNHALWGVTVRNNLFTEANMQCSIVLPNIRFYNNTFYRCDNGAHLLGYTFYDPDPANRPYFRGEGYGGVVLNNAFIECGGGRAGAGWYTVAYEQTGVGNLTPLHAGGGGRTGSGRAYARFENGLRVYGVYTNLSGTIQRGVVLLNGRDAYTVGASYFTNNWFLKDHAWVAGAGGYTVAEQQNYLYYGVVAFRIETTTYTNGEISGPLPKFVPSPAPDLVADYNFVSSIGGLAKRGFREEHGINGGNPKLVNPGTNFHLRPESILLDAGTNLTSLGVTNDYSGVPRPQGTAFDLGAYEYDPGLKPH